MNLAHPYRSMQSPLAAPPRRIPLAVRIPLLFGGWAALVGWVMILAAGFFGWGHAPNVDFTTPFLRTSDSAPARVEAVRVYSHSSGEDGEQTTWAVDYRFQLYEQTVSGRSYTSQTPPRDGDTLTADFPHGAPERSCLHGMRRKPLPLFASIFEFGIALVGFAFVSLGSKKGRRALELLRDGEVARARLVDKTGTSVYVNEQQVFRMRFQFEAANGRTYDVVAKTHHPSRLEDDPTEQVLYLPSDPRYATLLDHLPGAPRVLDDGTIAPGNAGAAILIALLVAATLVTHLAGAWSVLATR